MIGHGDHLHSNNAGYRKMGEAPGLKLPGGKQPRLSNHPLAQANYLAL